MMNKKYWNMLCVLISTFLISSCATHSILEGDKKVKYRNIKQYFKNSDILQDHFTGFTLYDFDDKAYLFQQNEDKYFTPASNTKLWTLFASLEVLGDSIAWMAYEDVEDKRIFFPMGDPTFLNPFLEENRRIANYFKRNFAEGDTIYFSTDHYQDFRYGEGWMWDDQSYYFQTEKCVFPIHANSVKLTPTQEVLKHEPEWMTVYAGISDHTSRYREEYQNVFVVPRSQTYPSYMPVIIDRDHYRSYFKSIGLHLEFVNREYHASVVQTIYSLPSHDLYRYYMEESDNLIAEQLLLQCSQKKLGYMNTRDLIDTLMNGEMARWKTSWNWHDGSGISRYNLVTPAAMVTLMNTIYSKYDQKMIEDILPTGGEGTLEKWYGYDPPRVFAKTGTVKYCHNLTGVIHTKKGNRLTFSFMHNNFNYSSTHVKEAMSDVLDIIIELY